MGIIDEGTPLSGHLTTRSFVNYECSTSASGLNLVMTMRPTEHTNGKMRWYLLVVYMLKKISLQTRTVFVQNEENELENKRNHCESIAPIYAMMVIY